MSQPVRVGQTSTSWECDAGKVQAFLNQVSDFVLQGILDEEEADELLRLGKILKDSVVRR